MKPLKNKIDFDIQKAWKKMKELETSVWNQIRTMDQLDEEEEEQVPYKEPDRYENEEVYKRNRREAEEKSYPSSQPKKIGIRGDLNYPQENQKMINCPYCGAENIVPQWEDGYYCYFCWHSLE